VLPSPAAAAAGAGASSHGIPTLIPHQ